MRGVPVVATSDIVITATSRLKYLVSLNHLSLMSIARKIFTRLKNEVLYARLSLWSHFVYYRRPCRGDMREAPKGEFCDLAAITFNNAKLVDYQIRTLRKFFIYPFRYTVFDNSPVDEKAREIEKICINNDIGYARLPRQEFLPPEMGSYSHGIACNYVYRHFIKNGGAKYFGLLDHDIFPVEIFDISVFLDHQPFYGIKHGGYLWPGFFFIRMDWVVKKKPDFRPSLHLHGDTGACNFYSLFKNIDFSRYKLVTYENVCFDDYDDVFQYGFSKLNCGWIHCWNASNYMKKESIDFKMNMIYKMLDEKLI